MPGMDGHAVCRALRAEPATSFMPVVMVTASGEQEKAGALESGADDFVDQAVRARRSCWRASGRCCGSSATTTRWRRRPPSSSASTRGSSSGSAELRRFLSPQVAELLVTAGDESFLESHRREIAGRRVRAARLRRVRGERRARGRDGGAGRVPPRRRRAPARVRGDGRPLHRRRAADRLLQRPGALPGSRRARGAARHRGAQPRVGAGRGLEPRSATSCTPRVGVAQGHATLGRIGIASRSDYAAIGGADAARGAAVRGGGAGADPDRPPRARRGGIARRLPSGGELALRGLTRPAPAFDLVGLDASAAAA